MEQFFLCFYFLNDRSYLILGTEKKTKLESYSVGQNLYKCIQKQYSAIGTKWSMFLYRANSRYKTVITRRLGDSIQIVLIQGSR